MRIAVDRASTKASGSSTRVHRPAPPAPAPQHAAQDTVLPDVRPSANLLALQRLIAGPPSPRPPGNPGAMSNAQIHEVAKNGASGPLPHLDTIQRSFGKHDVSGVAAHTDGTTAEAARAIAPTRVAITPAPIPRKAAISSPSDQHEREADEVADRVLRMAEPVLNRTSPGVPQRECTECGEDSKKEIQLKGTRLAGRETALDVRGAVRVVQRTGTPLPMEIRSYFEPRFGYDFSRVQLHTDGEAAVAARGVRARAYTIGRHIVFASGEYHPNTAGGMRLLAHELVHTIQQGAVARVQDQPRISGDTTDLLQRLCNDRWSCSGGAACSIADIAGSGASTWWTLVLKIDIEANSAEDVSPRECNVGHTYVEFSESNGTRWTFGFYPAAQAPDPWFHPRVRGCVAHPDTTHAPCVDHDQVYTLTQEQYERALTWAQQQCQAPPTYDLLVYNCTTFARDLAGQADIALPPIRSRVGHGTWSVDADNPYGLYDGLVPTGRLFSDTQIREWVAAHGVAELRAPAVHEKVRLLNRLLSGWVSDADLAAVDSICSVSAASEGAILRPALTAHVRHLTDIGQRIQLRLIIQRLP